MTPPWLAYACLAASMTLVGSYVGLSKLLVVVFPVFLLAWLRFGIAALAMLNWVPVRAGESALTTPQRVLMFWMSFLGNFLFSICMLYGVKLTSALAVGVTMAGIPAAVALLSWLFLRERIGARMLVAIALAMAGIALLALARGSSGAESASVWGYALLLAATLCEASYVVIGKRLSSHVSPKRISALINLWGLALVTPLGLWQVLTFDFRAVSASSWALLTFYALAASVVSVWLWMRGLREVAAPRAGVFTVLLPISAAAVGIGLLGEVVTAVHVVALALALASLLLATWPARPATQAA